MAPRGRGRGRRKAGSTREDAARDRMRDLGFAERVINESINQLLEVYGEDHWYLIESEGYEALYLICLEKQKELDKQLAEEQKEVAQEEQHDVIEQELDQHVEDNQEQELNQHVEDNQEQESDQHVEDVRDHADQLSITQEAVTDLSPSTVHSAEASADYAPHSVAVDGMNCGWLSSEEDTDPEENSYGGDDEMIEQTPEPLCKKDTDPEENSDGDGDDDEMIQLTPEPLCEELEELLREVRGQKKRKRESRWDK